MISVKVTKKQIKQFCSPQIQVVQGFNTQNGDQMYVKFLRNNLIDQLNISECLEFNRYVLGQPQNLVFSNHFLKIQQEISNANVVGFVTQPYSTTLSSYLRQKKRDQKEALMIFEQILKAIYSLYHEGYSIKNIRSQHFVLSNKIWKLESLVYDQNYKHANGLSIDYLWCPKHQAPECFKKSIFTDQEYQSMIVWNLGSILIQILLGTHKLSTLQTMQRFKGASFTFQALGIKENITSKFSNELKETLQYMLHFDQKKRTKLTQLFQNKMLSIQVAKHYQLNKKNVPNSKILTGKSSIRKSKVDVGDQKTLQQINKTLKQNQQNKKKALKASTISSVLGEQDFLDDLCEVSNRIPCKQIHNFNKKKAPQQAEQQRPVIRPERLLQTQSMDYIMQSNDLQIRKALQIYKSYFDQSQLLIQAIDVIERLEFANMSSKEVNQLKMLIKYAITFVSLVNLNNLTEGFNQNLNILDLDGLSYTFFQDSAEYSAFQKIVNFKRTQRDQNLESIKSQILMNKERPIMNNNPSLAKMLNLKYKQTSFQEIKTSYRFVIEFVIKIVKYAYDAIAEQYNKLKKTDIAQKLAQTAMYVTYCLTIDKLYIKDHITDNFKFYFDWIKKPASIYVPLNDFKKYLSEAPKEILIENSRYILKKYYNI